MVGSTGLGAAAGAGDGRACVGGAGGAVGFGEWLVGKRIVASTGRAAAGVGDSGAGGWFATRGSGGVTASSSGAQSGIGVGCGLGGVSGVRPGSAISLGAYQSGIDVNATVGLGTQTYGVLAAFNP